MKICFVNRDPRLGGTSIEEIFKGLGHQLSEKADILHYHYDSRKSLIKNVQMLRAIEADVYHITGGVYFLIYFLMHHPVVLTIHDIGGYKELAGIKKWIFKNLYLKWPMKLAKVITTVSDYTRMDVLRFFGQELSSKIVVIYNPIPAQFFRNDKKFDDRQPRLLQVGTGRNKNLGSLILAVANMDIKLVIIGRISREDQDKLERLKVNYENYVSLEYKEVFQQFNLADIVLFVSTHEGFGMPVIEGQALGRPVIASRITSIPEIGGDGVHYIENPFNIEEIRVAIKKVISDGHYRKGLVEDGFKNIDRFKMGDIAKTYLSLYEKIAN